MIAVDFALALVVWSTVCGVVLYIGSRIERRRLLDADRSARIVSERQRP